MRQEHDIDERMIRYLLGESSEEELAQMEAQFFADDECFGRLLAAEDDLIDDYVRDDLPPSQREQFERHFLTSTQRRERVEFARALMKTVSAAPPGRPVQTRPEPISGRPPFLGRPAIQWAMAALALVAIAVSAWLLVQTMQLRTQLARLQQQQQEWQQREQVIQQEIAQAREQSSQFAERLEHERAERARLEQELAQPTPSRPAIVSFVLSALARDPGEAKKLMIPPNISLVQFQIDLESGESYQSYRALVRTMTEREVWSHGGLQARLATWGQSVMLRVPARVLLPGEYELVLRGVTPQGAFEDVGYYYFSVVKKE